MLPLKLSNSPSLVCQPCACTRELKVAFWSLFPYCQLFSSIAAPLYHVQPLQGFLVLLRHVCVLFCGSIYDSSSLFISCIRFVVDSSQPGVCHTAVILGEVKCAHVQARKNSFSPCNRNSQTLCGCEWEGSPCPSAVGNAKFLKLGLGSWCVYSSVWKPDPDLVKQLRAVSEPALSIGLMEIKTFLSSSAVLADLSYVIY